MKEKKSRWLVGFFPSSSSSCVTRYAQKTKRQTWKEKQNRSVNRLRPMFYLSSSYYSAGDRDRLIRRLLLPARPAPFLLP